MGTVGYVDLSDDRVAIADLFARFATGIDSCDWAMYRGVFTDEIDLDYSSWRAGSIGRWTADEWVARATRLFAGLTPTRHALTNLVVDFDGHTARVRANVCADHVVVDGEITEVFTLNGFYDDVCVLQTDGWRITGKRLVAQWTVGDRGLLDRAAQLVADGERRRT